LYGDGTSERDYTYVDDLLQGLEGALEWARERFGSDPEWDFREGVRAFVEWFKD